MKSKEVIMLSDEELIPRLLNKEQDAYLYLMDTYNKLLWVIVGGILGKVGTTQDIEECISDVFIQLWKNPQAFNQQKGTLKAYLAVIAKSRALNIYKKLAKVKIIELDEAIQSTDDDLFDYIVEKDMSQELYEAIKTLVEPNKEIIIRRYFFDEKPKKIAESISMSIKEVENRLYQSKIKLRKILEGGRYCG